MKRLLSLALSAIFCFAVLTAATIDNARTMINNGDYAAAMEVLAPLKKKSPKDAKTNYYYGLAARGLGRRADAVPALRIAGERGYYDAYLSLAEMALELYDVDAAENYVADWREALKKNRRSEPESLREIEARIVRMSNQLDRVEAIPVIARYTVARESFDNALNSLNSSDLATGYSFVGSQPVPFFINNTGREVFWTAKDGDGVSRLFTAGLLDDGTREDARELTEYIGDGDILAPFIMEDGETLYFAARRDDSLGGYDIYMTRRDGEGGFYEPSNVGMPYNSPDDELLFVIDEHRNLGWWASTRAGDPDSVSIYVFIPNKSRINIDTDSDDIAARARLTDITATWPDGFDAKAAAARIPAPGNIETPASQSTGSSAFVLSLGNGRIVRSMKDFRNRDAASAMSDVLRLRNALNDAIARLKSMRMEYADGNTALKGDIRALEAQVEKQQKDLRDATNRVIRLESTH